MDLDRKCQFQQIYYFINLKFLKPLMIMSNWILFILIFQRAFDKTNHKLLLNKLVSFGFRGKFLKWIDFDSHI